MPLHLMRCLYAVCGSEEKKQGLLVRKGEEKEKDKKVSNSKG